MSHLNPINALNRPQKLKWEDARQRICYVNKRRPVSLYLFIHNKWSSPFLFKFLYDGGVIVAAKNGDMWRMGIFPVWEWIPRKTRIAENLPYPSISIHCQEPDEREEKGCRKGADQRHLPQLKE